MTRLILWDVDLTLVATGPFGRDLYGAAFERATGHLMRHQAPVAGRLDPDIFRDTVVGSGLDPSDHSFSRFADALAEVYAARADELGRCGSALPGARHALEALAKHPMVVQTVVTGNVRPVAIIKLSAFGLDGYLDLDVGAFATDAETRAELVALARRRAGAKHDATFDPLRTVLIGDSRHDVTAGRDGGARVIAVATGRDTAAELRDAGAPVVLASLDDARALMRAIWD